MTQLETLYDLQDVDLAILHAEERLAEIHAALADNAAVQAAQASVEKAEQQLKPLQTDIRDLELQIQSNRSKHERTQKRLYSGSVSNPRELEDMQNEIAALDRYKSELEDKLLEVMVALDEAEAQLNDAQATLKQVTDDAAAENKDLLAEKQSLESNLDDYASRRASLTAQLDADMLQLYDTLRQKKANRPLAQMKADNSCAACGVQQNNAAARRVRQSDDEVIYCNNCGRILVQG